MIETSATALVEFEALVDTDFGILQIIKEEFNNPKFVDVDYLNKASFNALLAELYERKDENPLSLILKKEYLDQEDALYDQFMSSKKERILELSNPTNLLGLFKLYEEQQQFEVTVLCKDIHEQQYIDNLNLKFKTIIYNNEEQNDSLDVRKYDFIYLKNIKDCINMDPLLKKNIYICKYGFNVENDNMTPLIEYTKAIGQFNQISTIEAYSISYEIEG